jgi:hypothetical protein
VRRIKDEPRWLRRACALSLALHVVVAAALWWWISTHEELGAASPVDVELAPEAPQAQKLAAEKEAEEKLAAAEQAMAAGWQQQKPPDEPGDYAIDAGVPDAGVVSDARVRRRDAGDLDAGDLDAGDLDAGALDANDEMFATAGGDGGAPISDDGGAGDGGVEVAVGVSTDGGAPTTPVSDDDAIGVTATSVAPGTGANLLSYFPKGHVVTLLLRFDRLRGTEWAPATEAVLAPMPDYQTIIGDRPVHIADVFDTLVISTPSPRDVEATTLVGRSVMAPADLRALLDHDGAPVAWSPASGGALGRRRAGARVFPGDRRVFLSPFAGWIVLAQPGDLGTLTRPGHGDLDTLVAPDAALPDWLRRVHTIESESGTPTGPALVLTMSALAGRYDLPDIGVGVTSLPAPERITLALEIDAHGFVVRGNLRFATDADAAEAAASLTKIHDSVMDSRLLREVLSQAHALNVIKGLSVVRTGKRVSYATSLSIADARALMALAAKMVGDYYGQQRIPAPAPTPTPAPAPPPPAHKQP